MTTSHGGQRPRGSTAMAEELVVSEERWQRVVEDLGVAHLGLGRLGFF
ncbi:hypothetical protein ES332_A02G169400v1 [Gossypium tomentosum]|uniref:Uncharacterized protein n=1 Tax=Gossypium tomentosum TaxID=34277 RepID=A0A5D2RJA1_GOSTO|nr:hypothetical protein ES332_A02G169400v1 [Gossypium tomentosum]